MSSLDKMRGLGRPLRADAERNRRRILAAAAEVFARRGLDAGLDEIARHAGVGTGTVYRRFPEKSMLIDALFESRIDDLIEMARAALEWPDPWVGLVHFLEDSIEMQQADRGLKEVLFGEGHPAGTRPPVGPRFSAKLDLLLPLFSALVERARESGQLRPDIEVTDLAVLQFTLHESGRFSTPAQPEFWRRQFAVLLDGLRTERRAPSPLPGTALSVLELNALCGDPDALSMCQRLAEAPPTPDPLTRPDAAGRA